MRTVLTKNKRGPRSYQSKAKRQRGAGLVTRRETRKWANASPHTLKSVRAGWNLAWKHAKDYLKRKRIPKTYRKGNIHAGKLFASRNECKMSNHIAGQIIDKVYESGEATLDQLKKVRHMLSYSFYLVMGESESNWPEVAEQWKSFDMATLPKPSSTTKAKSIPTPENLKLAFMKPWTFESRWPLVKWTTGALAAHDYFIFGLRPRVDIDKVKNSTTHVINTNERYGYTAMKGGRSKLHGLKKGTRPWNVFRVCFCKGRKHKSPPVNLVLDEEGNPQELPQWNTCCPLAMMELIRNLQGTEQWRPYAKWNDSGTVSKSNHGDTPLFANKWLHHQVSLPLFDQNSGRKALARWLEELKVAYELGFQIHGDLPKTWRDSYQPSIPRTTFPDRRQSGDPDTATRALRAFAKWLNEEKENKSLKQKLEEILAQLS